MSIDNPIDAAGRIEQISKQQSAVNGIHELQNLVNDYQSHHDAKATQQFCAQLTQKLQADNFMPALAVAWAKEGLPNFSHDGYQLSKRDLNQVPTYQTSNPMDRTFAQIIYNQFDKLKAMHKDQMFGDAPGITMGDLDAAMQGFETSRKQQLKTEHDQGAVKDLTGGLVANGDALFQKIARQHGASSKDTNFITLDDLQKIQKADQDLRQATDGKRSILTADEKKSVDKLIKGWYTPELEAAKENYRPKTPDGTFYGALSLNGIAKAQGFKDADDMHKHQAASPEQAKPPEQKPAAPKPGEQKPGSPKPPERKPGTPPQDQPVPPGGPQPEAPHKPHLLPRPKEAAHDNELPPEMPRWGEGYIKIARRLLGDKATPGDVMDLVKTLEDLNHNAPVRYGHAIKLPEKYMQKPGNEDIDYDNLCDPNSGQ